MNEKEVTTVSEAFEIFAKERGLDLSRKPHHPNDYASTMTEVAWMGFQGGRKANVRIITATKTWEHPAKKLSRFGN